MMETDNERLDEISCHGMQSSKGVRENTPSNRFSQKFAGAKSRVRRGYNYVLTNKSRIWDALYLAPFACFLTGCLITFLVYFIFNYELPFPVPFMSVKTVLVVMAYGLITIVLVMIVKRHYEKCIAVWVSVSSWVVIALPLFIYFWDMPRLVDSEPYYLLGFLVMLFSLITVMAGIFAIINSNEMRLRKMILIFYAVLFLFWGLFLSESRTNYSGGEGGYINQNPL